LDPGLTLLQAATALEARLAPHSVGSGEEDPGLRRALLAASLASQLEGAAAAWPAGGAQGERRTVVGGQLAVRAFLSPQLEPLFKPDGGGGGGGGGGSPGAQPTVPNVPSALTKYLGIVAIGTCSGSAHVLMPATGKAQRWAGQGHLQRFACLGG
jgi:hypothetical protein